MLLSTSSHLRQGPTHVTDTGRCPTPCLNPTEVARLGQLFLCCSQSGASPSSQACLVLFPALRLSRAAVCAATELSVRCSQDLFNLRTPFVLRPDRRGELVVTYWGEVLRGNRRHWGHAEGRLIGMRVRVGMVRMLGDRVQVRMVRMLLERTLLAL